MSYSGKRKEEKRQGRAKDERSRKRYKSTQEGHTTNQASSMPRSGKNMVDAETFQYFMEISGLVGEGAGSITDPEELSTLCANGLEETQGKELQLACDKSCSRVLETLFPYCDMGHILSFLHRSSSVFATIAMDACGSHVAEAALKSAAAVVYSSGTEQARYEPLKKVLLKISENIVERAEDVMCNCYGSHVLRSLLSLAAGTLLDPKYGGNSSGLACRLSRSHLNTNVSPVKKKSNAFPDLLDFLVNKLLKSVKKSSFQLQMDPFAGPVLQTVLKALEGDSDAITRAIALVLGCDDEGVGNNGNVLQSASKEKVMELVYDNKSSHLMEVILEAAPDALYKELLEHFFQHNLVELSLHQSANFVVQALIASARHQDQVIIIFEELENHFLRLIRERRAGVIASLLGACGRYGIKQRQACRLLARAIVPHTEFLKCLIPRMIFLESYARSEVSENWRPEFQGKMSVLGSAMLKTIFSYPQEFNQQFCSSLAALEANDLFEMAKNASGGHVLESFLTSTTSHKQKQRVISRLKGNFGHLATDTISSFVVEKCFSVADIALKEVITSELASIDTELSNSKHGPYLLKKFDVAGFLKSPEQWRIRMKSKQDILKGFSEIFHPDGNNSTNPDKSKRLTSSPNEATMLNESRNTDKELGYMSNFRRTSKNSTTKDIVDKSCSNPLMDQLDSYIPIPDQRSEDGKDELHVQSKRRLKQTSISKVKVKKATFNRGKNE